MVCVKVVCDRERVTKLCERWCVKVVCDRERVTKLCVKDGVCESCV